VDRDIFLRIEELKKKLQGDLKYDSVTRVIYSTDASVYKETPLCVVWPKNKDDIKEVLKFAAAEKVGVIPRAGGTSLAGQVVGNGIVLDVSRYMNRIIEIDTERKTVRVEPGVILDHLNIFLRTYGLFFGPETSTANRCNIGGMVGNNACGLHSLVYGSTRDHTIEVKALLSDASEVVFGPVDRETFTRKCDLETLEGQIYRNIRDILSDEKNRETIVSEYPDRKVTRRNTGYAIDLLLDSEIFTENSANKFNFCNLLAGSEGTLAVITEICLNLVPLPPSFKALVCVHLKERNEAFLANLIALKHNPSAVEMMDNRILELTRGNIGQSRNRFFIEGDPGAILIVEFVRDSQAELDEDAGKMISDMKKAGFGYHFPVVSGKDIPRVWNLRKAGLGVLSNMKGDAKPVSLVEDTAVNVELLPSYMKEFEEMMGRFGKDCVYHAHIGTGELHLRPVLNLKDPGDVEMFRAIGLETAHLVKKYRGSMSGEHGDGRLRGEFIPIILGGHNFNLIGQIKKCWDPLNILNPGKITFTEPMNSHLRYIPGKETPHLETWYDFSSTGGIVRAAENCNGSADCRKTVLSGGVMCPSYMATGDEKNTTRARANVIREYFWKEGSDPWNHREIYDILDLCLSCKGCKSECPSNVDIAKIKSEFLQHWYDRHGVPLRSLFVAYMPYISKAGSLIPSVFNYFAGNDFLSGLIKRSIKFAVQRPIPLLYRTTLRKWLKNNLPVINPADPVATVYLFIDEFTDLNDTETGIKAVQLLTELNYRVEYTDNKPSARTFISKGLLRRARKIIDYNITLYRELINENSVLIGVEPSAILGFRDEFPELASPGLREDARNLSKHCYLFDEFIANEFRMGRIRREQFTDASREILVHTHCQQKSVASSASLIESLSIPVNYKVSEIPSGCCGMAGSFGYEKEHYELSNRIGELVLFPAVRGSSENTIITAPGTSCRHHIEEGTGKKALHPAVVLYEALAKKTLP